MQVSPIFPQTYVSSIYPAGTATELIKDIACAVKWFSGIYTRKMNEERIVYIFSSSQYLLVYNSSLFLSTVTKTFQFPPPSTLGQL